MKVYKYNLTKLIEIFDRKVQVEQKFKSLEIENRDEHFHHSIREKIEMLKEELRYEISLFKDHEENELVKILKNFFKSLYENNAEILNKV